MSARGPGAGAITGRGEMRRLSAKMRLAAVIVAASGFAGVVQAGAVGNEVTVEIRSDQQAVVAETKKVVVNLSSARAGMARLAMRIRFSSSSRKMRRFGPPTTIEIPAGESKVVLRLSKAGLRRLRSLRRTCRDAAIKVNARVSADGLRSRAKARRTLAPDANRCRTGAPGGGSPPGGAPPGGAPGGGAGGGGGGGGGNPGVESNVKAGAATADITPPVGTPMFAYTARSGLANPPRGLQILADPDENLYAKSFEPSDGIHTRVRAAAIVIEQNSRKFALVQADLGGLPYALVQEVLRRIAATGITGERLMVSATHTHSSTGPIWPIDSLGYGLLGGDLFDPRIFEITAEGITEAILAADANLEPALVGVGRAELRGASRNRNFDPFRRNPDVPADEAGAREASINPKVTVIRVDSVGGSPLGVWSNFAIHPTSFGDSNLLFSGDNAATTERVVEREITAEAAAAGDAPENPFVNVWTNSAQGDVSPDGGSPNPDGEPLYYVPTSAAGANMAGLKVAGGILEAWRNAGDELTGTPVLDARRTFTLFDGTQADGRPVGPIEALGAGGIVADDGFCALVEDQAGPGQGKKFGAVSGIGLVPSSAAISLWRLGDLGIASFPTEITTQMGRRIAAAVSSASVGRLSDTIIAGLTNGYNSYTATPEEYDACHYEGSFTLFGRHQGPRYRDVVSTLVDPLLGSMPAPPGLEPPPSGLGLPALPPLFPTPEAGEATIQPPDSLRRYQRAVFTWKGGDPGVDAPRGEAFVSLQRRDGADWVTVGTEDGPEDTTVWNDADGTWTETWQFAECDPLGTYRFHVEGRAIRSLLGPTESYELDSESFFLGSTLPLELVDSSINGTTARLRARYPNPGPSLLALPRRVRTGTATLSLSGPGPDSVVAQPDADRLGFIADVPAGSSIEGISVEDGCGNST